MKEEWRDIQGYEGLYQVSNLGRVKSLERKVAFGNRIRTISEKILSAGYNKKGHEGYLTVNLHKKNDRGKPHYLHRLVAEAFIDNPNNYKEVNHKDEDPTNNCVNNLEWCTRQYNENYGTKRQRQMQTVSWRIKPVIAYKEGVEVMRFQSAMEAERELGYCSCSIYKCCKGLQKKQYKGLTWKYAS